MTKTAIQYFEGNFDYNDYIVERNEKESKLKGAQKQADKQADPNDSANDNSDLDEEEEEDYINPDWNRAMAETLYSETRLNLNQFYGPPPE